MPTGREPCVVALIGFGPRPPRQLRGLLERCGWPALHLASLVEATELLRSRVQATVVVVDAEAIATFDDAEVQAFRQFVAAPPYSGTLPVIVVSRAVRPNEQAARLEPGPVHRLHGPGSYYQHLGALIRTLVAAAQPCCVDTGRVGLAPDDGSR